MTPQSTVEKRDSAIRRILDSAADSFAKSGFEGARMDNIAKHAKINKAMIYYHIGDKKALYARVLHDIIGDAADHFKETVDRIKTPEEKLKRLIRTIADTMDQHPHLAPIMLREQASGGRNLPDVIAQAFAAIIGIVTDILEKGTKQGVFIKTTPFVIYSLVTGSVMFYKGSYPVRSGYTGFPETVKKLGDSVSGDFSSEIEKLILKAVKK
ncbi:MAG: TetR/AcrR family transcriptional regulator [Deltaproteobacteria bacterium]|nr:TetR/AcrR family transcriptional regulator [Deltaproteobacteria bacterium]